MIQLKRPASQEMSGAEYGSPCVRYRDTWKGNTQAVHIGMYRCHDKTCLQAHNLTAFGTIEHECMRDLSAKQKT